MVDFCTFIDNPQMLAHTAELSFRLKPSSIAGVGVFSTHGIAAGTYLHLRVETLDEVRFVSLREVADNRQMLLFCQWYGVAAFESEPGFWVSANFNQMSMLWYLNHSDTPNTYRDENYEWFASCNITAGDELTVDYTTL